MSLILVITWYACSRHFQETLSSPCLALQKYICAPYRNITSYTFRKNASLFFLETVKIEKVDFKWIFLPVDSVLILNFTKFYQFYECRYWFSTPTSEINSIWEVSLTLAVALNLAIRGQSIFFGGGGGVENETKNVRGK